MQNYDEYSKNFEELLERYKKLDRNNSGSKRLIALLNSELREVKNSEALLKKKLNNNISASCNDHLLSTNLELKNLYENAKYENASLKQNIEQLKVDRDSKIMQLKGEYEEQYAALTKRQSEILEEFERREQKLMDTLTLTQSKSAMEYNLMETNLMQLIDESNKKIKALENANNIIRFELQTYKCKTSSDINNEKLDTLRKELQKVEHNAKMSNLIQSNNDPRTHNSNYNLISANDQSDEVIFGKSNNDFSNKETTFFNDNDSNTNMNIEMDSFAWNIEKTADNKCTINNLGDNNKVASYANVNIPKALNFVKSNNEKYRTLAVNITSNCVIDNDTRSVKKKSYNDKSYLPPLVQVTSNFQKKPTPMPKKRKLYNPNENEYCEF